MSSRSTTPSRSLTRTQQARLKLDLALRRWDREWGNVARNDGYAAPWDKELGEALQFAKEAKVYPYA